MALGMSAFPSFMTQATPATQPLINAEPAVAAQTEQNPQVGQVMPGVQGADAPVVAQNGPSRDVKLTFAQIAPPPGSMVLRGINPNGSIEFGMRSDEVVTKAMLNLEYTPSPSLLPVQSQLKVYLNDELMGVLPVTKEQLGKKTLAQMPINPLFITDFNRVRLEFVGHYQDVCENPASTTLRIRFCCWARRCSSLDIRFLLPEAELLCLVPELLLLLLLLPEARYVFLLLFPFLAELERAMLSLPLYYNMRIFRLPCSAGSHC